MLVRADVLEHLGGLDEQLFALEHVDVCMKASGEVNGGWFEPRSVVTYLPPSRLFVSDVPYYFLRWSKAWIDSSVARFCRTWDIGPGDPGLEENLRWLHAQRWRVLGHARPALRHRVGDRVGARFDALIDGAITNTLVRDARRRARAAVR